MEHAPELVDIARETLAGYDNARVVQAVGEEVRAVVARADRVTLHEVMQHMDKPLGLLMEVNELLAPAALPS